MRGVQRSSMHAALVLGTLVLASCATTSITGGAAGPAAEAPSVKLGDRWVYRGQDGYRVPVVWDETHEITSAGPEGITVRVTLKGPTIDLQRTETWSAPGIVRTGAVYEAETDRFEPSLIRYKYPLTVGETWRQSLRNANKPPDPFGPIQRYVNVTGYESVSTPAGTFDAIRMRVLMQLDDATFWRYGTDCDYLVWYAPSVGAMVKEEKRSSYREKEGMEGITVPGQHATVELISFSRGR